MVAFYEKNMSKRVRFKTNQVISLKTSDTLYLKARVQRALLALMHLLVFCGQQSKPMHSLQRSLNQRAEYNSQSRR